MGHFKTIWIAWLLTAYVSLPTVAQEKNLVQIKAFDKQLNPMTGISISINGKEFIDVVEKKSTFYEIPKEDLPPKSIKINKADLEAESWNYTRGTLEVIIRKKQYNVVEIVVQTADKKTLTGLVVSFKGIKNITATTGIGGAFKLPLALEDQISSVDQFSIPGYTVARMTTSDNGKVLIVEPTRRARSDAASGAAVIADFNLDRLDTVHTLTVFYALFKNIDISKLDPSIRTRIDAKFNELVTQLRESEKNQAFIGMISDSSFVKNDVANLLEQAKFENNLLDNFRDDFDEKIRIINQKLIGGTSTLPQADREKLLSDLTTLEGVLSQNEDKFYKNISEYRIILASLKRSFSDIKLLEDKLSLSERTRLQEQKDFRNQIIVASTVAVVFGALMVLLFLLRVRVEKQKKSLVKANAEVQRVNENLEVLVFERSKLLMEAYQEMDIFLYRSSHDLRAPICTIIGLCNLAMISAEGDLDLINRISNTAIKMDGMLKKLRMISEVNHPNNYLPVDVKGMISDVMQYFDGVIANKNIEVVIDSDNANGFYSYPDLLQIILYNLIENALFFSTLTHEHHPKIHIMASIDDNDLFLSIYDNGIGMDDKTKVKLWDMFFVGHEHSKGNGLGLYIVFKSVQSLNGKIDVETEANAFTRFSITIPINRRTTSPLTISNQPKVLAAAMN